METFTDETGTYITGFGISTKLNDALWTIDKQTGHELVKHFNGHHFAIIPELINKPIRLGGGGHYWGKDTYEDLLEGYKKHSHGIITKVKGPFYYNDGTDDYKYNFDIKLRDSKAASALKEHGQNTWVPFAVSPHIWPLKGPDTGYTDWKPVGVALVIKGAYGPESTITKICEGTEAACTKSLAASTGLCPDEDANMAEIISSYVSKSASSQIDMPEGNKADTANSPQVTELSKATEVSTGNNKTNPTVDSQSALTNASKQSTTVVTVEAFEAQAKENAELKKAVTQLQNDKKMNQLNTLFVKVKDAKQKQELVEKYMRVDNLDDKLAFLAEVSPILKSSEEEEQADKEEEEGDEQVEQKTGKTEKKKKSKAGSILTPESSIPTEETKKEESKAASTAEPENKLKTILQAVSGGSIF